MAAAGHHFFAVLISAHPGRIEFEIFIFRFEFGKLHLACDSVAHEHGTVKSKRHFARDKVDVAADLCR